jgi:hypothetical protein
MMIINTALAFVGIAGGSYLIVKLFEVYKHRLMKVKTIC